VRLAETGRGVREVRTFFKDRVDAGRQLAESLSNLKSEHGGLVVLGIPRGGVIVAKEVAHVLGSRLDVIVTRKIGAPGNQELAIGALTQQGDAILDVRMVESLRVPDSYVKDEVSRQVEEVDARMKNYRGDRPYPELAGKTVVIVDDGIATGSTMRAAVLSAKRMGASRAIVAAPVASSDSVGELAQVADDVICLRTVTEFYAVGEFYEDFGQVDDETVKEALRQQLDERASGTP
jgi:putative phosphoribosyl transferase